MTDAKAVNVPRLIAIPSLITLAVTILRVAGEVKHWPTPWVSTAAGGGGAILGIAWLPIIFGPYFALKLAGSGDTPASSGRVIGYAFLGLIVFFVGGAIAQRSFAHPGPLTLVAFLIMLGSAFLPAIGWRSLGRVLLGYALAARIPVLIVMYFAMAGNGGAGWGTHYDAVPPPLANFPVMTRYIMAGVMPQLTIWIGWTVIVGAICGGIAVAISNKGKHPAAVSA